MFYMINMGEKGGSLALASWQLSLSPRHHRLEGGREGGGERDREETPNHDCILTLQNHAGCSRSLKKLSCSMPGGLFGGTSAVALAKFLLGTQKKKSGRRRAGTRRKEAMSS